MKKVTKYQKNNYCNIKRERERNLKTFLKKILNI